MNKTLLNEWMNYYFFSPVSFNLLEVNLSDVHILSTAVLIDLQNFGIFKAHVFTLSEYVELLYKKNLVNVINFIFCFNLLISFHHILF